MAKQSFVPYVHSDGKTWEFYFVDTKSQVIYFIKSHNGKKVKFSTKQRVPNGVAAKRFANAEFDRRTGKNKRFVRTLIKEEIPLWLKVKESEGLDPGTMLAVRRCARQIEEFWGNRLPSEINRDSFAEWVKWWAETYPHLQMETQISKFNNFCTYLHEKIVNGQPLLASKVRFRDPKRHEIKAVREKKKQRIITPAEFQIIMQRAPGEIERLIVLFMYTMATRIDETMTLSFDRVDLEAEIPLYIWRTGTNKAKRIGSHALHLSLIEPLRALKRQREAEGTTYFFPQKLDNKKPLKPQQIEWGSWRVRAGLGWHWTPHTFRHTCLTNLFNDARNPQATIIKQYRVSLQVALDTYVKVTNESMLVLRDSIEVPK